VFFFMTFDSVGKLSVFPTDELTHIFQRGILNHQRCSTSWMDPLNSLTGRFLFISQLGEILTFWLNHYIMLYIYTYTHIYIHTYVYIHIYIYIFIFIQLKKPYHIGLFETLAVSFCQVILSQTLFGLTLLRSQTASGSGVQSNWRPGDSPCGTFRMVPSGNLMEFNGDSMVI